VTVISPDLTFITSVFEVGEGVKFVVPSVTVPLATAVRKKLTKIPFTSRPRRNVLDDASPHHFVGNFASRSTF
jgi:hypothetical protein